MKAHALVGTLLVAACGGGNGTSTGIDANADTGSNGSHLVDGMIVSVGGGQPPARGDTIVAWSSDIGQGDFIYKWGMGTATSTTFTADVMTPVPNDATFGGIMGVGIVTLIASGTNVPDGVLANSTFMQIALGYTGEYAVIYRPSSSSVPGATWLDAFPVGLACGKCVHQTSGFDTFTPVSCSEVKLQVGPTSAIVGCNWT